MDKSDLKYEGLEWKDVESTKMGKVIKIRQARLQNENHELHLRLRNLVEDHKLSLKNIQV